MKLSLNLQGEDNPLLKAKIPVSIFDQPFTSIFTTAANSFTDISFSFSTNFPSGPSLKLAYAPPSTATSRPFSPISLSLKSGLGLFGSPQNSPLVFSAHFSVSNVSPNAIIPTFYLHFKPRFGHFSLHKRTASSSNPKSLLDSGTHLVSGSNLDCCWYSNSEFINGNAPDGPLGWQEVKLEPFNGKEKEGFAHVKSYDIDGINNGHNSGIGFWPDRQLLGRDVKKGGFVGGVALNARTVLPLSKRVKVNLRWGVNLPCDLGIKMPYLTVNKIEIERVEKMKEIKEKGNENNAGDLELMKGMFSWIRRDLEIVEKENKDLKHCLEDMKLGISAKKLNGENTSVVKNLAPASSDRLGEFGQWKSKKNDEGNRQTEIKKPANRVVDLENELQKAIKASAS